MYQQNQTGGIAAIIGTISDFFRCRPRHPRDLPLDAEYAPYRQELSLVGLDEQALRDMDPDDRVAALEQARLDPYDYIYLAC